MAGESRYSQIRSGTMGGDSRYEQIRKKRQATVPATAPATTQPRTTGFIQNVKNAPSNIAALRRGEFSIRDVAREVPGQLMKHTRGALDFLLPGLTKNLDVLGEGLAYATDETVRKQYEAGNTEILPTITESTQKDVWRNTVATGLAATVLKAVPQSAGAGFLARAGRGGVEGIGLAIADGMANKKTADEVIESLRAYGIGGAAVSIIAPYLAPVLAKELSKVSDDAARLVKEGPDLAKVKTATEEAIPEQVVGEKAMAEQAVPEQMDPVLRTPNRFQSMTGVKLREEARLRGINVAEIPEQEVRKMSDSWALADDVTKDFNMAESILAKKAPLPQGLEYGDIYRSLSMRVEDAIAAGKSEYTDLLNKLATKYSERGTEAARGLKAFDRPNPTVADLIKDINIERASSIKKRTGKDPGIVGEKVKKDARAVMREALAKNEIKIQELDKELQNAVC